MTREQVLESIMDVLTDPRVGDETERKLSYILEVVTDDEPREDDETNTESDQHGKRVSMLLETAERVIADHQRANRRKAA